MHLGHQRLAQQELVDCGEDFWLPLLELLEACHLNGESLGRQHQELRLQLPQVGEGDGVGVPVVEEEADARVLSYGFNTNSMPFGSSLGCVHIANLDCWQWTVVLRVKASKEGPKWLDLPGSSGGPCPRGERPNGQPKFHREV